MADPELSPSAVYLLLVRLEKQVSEGFDGINDRLDSLNGKVNRHETAIAVLTAKAESPPEAPSVRGSAMKWSAIGGGVIATIIETVKALWPNGAGQ